MKINSSVQRIKWRFGLNKSFHPNQNDINALNDIIEYVNQKEQEQFTNNQLFGKLYCYLFAQFVKYYKTTYDDPIPQKELNKLCDMDLNLLMQKITDDLNFCEMVLWEKNNGKLPLPNVPVEEVKTNLQIMVNAAINSYN